MDALGFRNTTMYDAAGRTVASQNALGFLSTSVYDAASRSIASVDALGNRWTTNYDVANRSVSNSDPLGRTSTVLYDAASRTSASIQPLGQRTSYQYDAVGQNISVQDARGAFSTSVYDSLGRQSASISPLGYRTTSLYDANSRQIAQQDALGFLFTTVYDGDGRGIANIDPRGSRTTLQYDAVGRTVASVDVLGHRTSSVYDGIGQNISTQNGLGFFKTHLYDAIGRDVALVDANSRRTTNLYSGRGEALSTQDPLGAFTSFQYDGVGSRILRTDARNWPTTYTMDALNRTVGEQYILGQVDIDGTRVTNTFDAAGQQLAQQNFLGTRSFGYDLNGRQTSVAYPTGLILTYSFDAVSNRASMLDPDNGLTTYSYDVQNRLTAILNPVSETTTISYDALDRELKKTLANGMTVSHAYDASGRETLLENRNAAGAGLAIFTNTYDSIGNRLTVAELDGTRATFAYDSMYQLVNEQRSGAKVYNTTYAYDPVGNRLSKNDSGSVTANLYNAANALILTTPAAGSPTTSSYDANGNLSQQNTGGTVTNYVWDYENRLLSATGGGTTYFAAHSADGMVQRTSDGVATVNKVWDDQNLLQERVGALVKDVQYTDFPGYWGGLSSQRRGGASGFFGFDSQGSTRILVSVGGIVTDSYSFKAFGEELASGSGTTNPYRYVGAFGYYRDTANRYYVRARHLSVPDGRWISRDPIGFYGEDWNLYRYVNNRPVSQKDPSGNICLTCGANLDTWIIGELSTQITNAKAFFKKVIAIGDQSRIHPIIWWSCGRTFGQALTNYAGWANEHQGYKTMPKLGIAPKCPIGNPCQPTITLCNTCFSRVQLGNMVYGLVGQQLGFTLPGLTGVVDCIKTLAGKPISQEKHDAYSLGYAIGKTGGKALTNLGQFCKAFSANLPKYPKAILDYQNISYKTCLPCNNATQNPASGYVSNHPFGECWDGNGGPNCSKVWE